MPLRVRVGKPTHYAAAVAAGLGVAAALGTVGALIRLGLFGFILPIAGGMMVGQVVVTTARRSNRALQIIAAGCAIAGFLAPGAVIAVMNGLPLRAGLGGGVLLWAGLAALFAALRAG